MQKQYSVFKRIYLILFALSIICSLSLSNISYAAVSKSPRLNIKNLSLAKGSTYKLRLYNISSDNTVSFQSSDTDTVIIKSAKGNSCTIKARSSGQTVITAVVSDDNGETISELKCKVTVTPPAVSVKFCKKKLKLTVGQSRKVKVSKKPLSSFEQPRFISDDPSIASVSSNGTITGHAAGKTIIRVSIANGKGGVCKVTVTNAKPTDKPNEKPNDIPDINIPQVTDSPEPSASPSDDPRHSHQNPPTGSDSKTAGSKFSNVTGIPIQDTEDIQTID